MRSPNFRVVEDESDEPIQESDVDRFLGALATGLGYSLGYGLGALTTVALGYCEFHYWFGWF